MTILRLSKDILVTVVGEWLNWHDISLCDIACLGSSRSDWLDVLAGLTFAHFPQSTRKERKLIYLLRQQLSLPLKTFYPWLAHRRVYLQDFPLDLTFLNEILSLDEKIFSRIQSLTVVSGSCEFVITTARAHYKLSYFLQRCVRLQSVRLEGGKNIDTLASLINHHVPALNNVVFDHVDQLSTTTLGTFLRPRQGGSAIRLDGLEMHACSGMSAGEVISLLRQQDPETPLRILTLDLKQETPALSQSQLLEFLSSHGKKLEYLHIEHLPKDLIVVEELIQSVLNLCPSLESLTLKTLKVDHVVIPPLFSLLQSFPMLKNLVVDDFSIDMNKEQRHVKLTGYKMKSSQAEIWMDSLLKCMKSDFALTISTIAVFTDNDTFQMMIEKLSPFLTSVCASLPNITDEVFEMMMMKCSKLEKLSISIGDPSISDRALLAIARYRSTMKELEISVRQQSSTLFSDYGVNQMVSACRSLVKLTIPFAGCHSLRAVAKLQNLRSFTLYKIDDMVEDLLEVVTDPTLTWSPFLLEGKINLSNNAGYFYVFAPILRPKVDDQFYKMRKHNIDDDCDSHLYMVAHPQSIKMLLFNKVELM
eukprot:gene2035-2218_t